MKRKGYAAVLAIALTTISLGKELAAEPFSLANYQAFSGKDFGFTLFPPGPEDRIYLKAPSRDTALQQNRRAFVASGSQVGRLRQLIGWVDAGPKDYDAVQYGARIRPGKRPTEMTIGEIFHWIDRTPGQHHAIGRYQFIPTTLHSVVRQAGVDQDTRFSPEVQDRLADILLVDAGLPAFLDGEISRHRFMENLARIWAAFPTSNGRSHYHGIAGNRAVISWSEFDSHMRTIFSGERGLLLEF
ncbi:hypothetical protein PSM7751_01391 [Pseudooceanicola marinus]|uniref:Uncharacterized protein n=1 Tax=Pseudooceanicola marinus TaxID=396013 RepID=A0A1X6YUQ3_9RHOB|nr:hypothetical protein [Pseudooceanicola marinus]SLN31911.1 hypothetical protein PSM7751_01391 [Pseudooceanicola marinus]